MPFEKEIKEYEELRKKYQTSIISKMDREEYIRYNEVLFSTHSCAIEGNFFFKMAMQRMQEEMRQKEANTRQFTNFLF